MSDCGWHFPRLLEFTFCLARALGNICTPGLLKLHRGWGDVLEKVRGLCFPYGQEGAGRAAAGAVSSPEAVSRRGKMVLCNVTISVQPSGPALMLGGCRLGPGSRELRPCWVCSCGWVGWVSGWFLLWQRGLCFLLDRIAVHVWQVHSLGWEFS